jgi:4-hydroxybenzoate polyprenyltransferase
MLVMKKQTLIGLWKANTPPFVWLWSPLWIGAIILGLDGAAPEWGPIGLFLVTMTVVIAIAQYANTYADREEDRIYIPTNPLVTGELTVKTARNVFILQNILAGLLLLALLLITSNYYLIIAMIAGWFAGLAYSLPPLRLKETVIGPIPHALGMALLPIVGWLLVAPLNRFIIAFAFFLFIHGLGFEITNKFRKTFHALSQGHIQYNQQDNLCNISTVGLKLKVKTAMITETITALGAFILVPVFWHMGIFDMPLSIGLLTLPLALTVLVIVLRIKDPVANGPKCMLFMTMAWIFIALILLGVALTSLFHLGFTILLCTAFIIVSLLLVRTIYPFGRRAFKAPWLEI